MKVIHIEELKRQLFDALKKQEDPRMAGDGNIFDEYPYSNPADRGLYERFMRGEKVRGSWANDSDIEKTSLEPAVPGR
jgi:N-sulfoglucosamine sulfohydrolase